MKQRQKFLSPSFSSGGGQSLRVKRGTNTQAPTYIRLTTYVKRVLQISSEDPVCVLQFCSWQHFSPHKALKYTQH